MKKLCIALSAITLIAVTSCSKEKIWGEGPSVSETRTMSGDFYGIECMIPAKVNYKIDPVRKVEIIAQRNILDIIETNMSSSSYVEVKFRNKVNVAAHDDIIINISGPIIYHLGLSGTGDIETE